MWPTVSRNFEALTSRVETHCYFNCALSCDTVLTYHVGHNSLVWQRAELAENTRTNCCVTKHELSNCVIVREKCQIVPRWHGDCSIHALPYKEDVQSLLWRRLDTMLTSYYVRTDEGLTHKAEYWCIREVGIYTNALLWEMKRAQSTMFVASCANLNYWKFNIVQFVIIIIIINKLLL